MIFNLYVLELEKLFEVKRLIVSSEVIFEKLYIKEF